MKPGILLEEWTNDKSVDPIERLFNLIVSLTARVSELENAVSELEARD